MPNIINVVSKGQTKIKSIKIYRARLLDAVVGKLISLRDSDKITVPYDIDDLDVSADDAAGILNSTKTSQEYLDRMREVSAFNLLNWQNAGSTQYTEDIHTFSSALKAEYTNSIKSLANSTNDDAKFREQVIEVDVTQYSSIKSITRDLNFNNVAVLSVSLPQLRTVAPTTAFAGTTVPLVLPEFVPRENDVVEIVMQYPDANGTEDRVFLGMIGLVNMSESYGDITELILTCYGLSKLLTTNMMVSSRGVISQFEDGSLSQAGLSTWSTNELSGSTVDEIFTYIMLNQLATSTTGFDADTDTRYRLGIESITMANSADAMETRFKELTTTLGNDNIQVITRDVNTKENSKPIFIDAVQSVADRDGFGNQDVPSLKTGVQNTVNAILRRFPNDINGSDAEEVEAAAILLALAQIQKRRISINNQLSQLGKPVTDANAAVPSLKFNFKFDMQVLTDTTSFQLLYVPLITMIAVRNREASKKFDDGLVGKFSGKRGRAFDILIREGYRLFFSQLQTPDQILNGLRTTTKFQVYENELNQIVAEIPRYNDFSADAGESIEDFIINNPLSINNVRQDMNLVTRVDVKAYLPFIPQASTESAIGTLILGQYTDVAALSRYGMRAQEPVYNPNVGIDTTSTNLFSALETTVKNADTRTMTVEVNADIRYKLGRLYFVRRTTLDTLVGDAPDGTVTPTILDGYVGYLYGYDTNVVAGSPITHTLAFKYVRKAKLIVGKNADGISTVVADFKILPDISGLIDIIENALRQGTLTEDQFKGATPASPSESAQAQQTHEENTYTTANNIPSQFATFVNLTGTHHDFIPPNKPPTNRISVIRVDDTGGGINKELVRAMHMVDMRLRPFNKVLLTTAINAFGLNSTELIDKRAIFYSKYIPTYSTNPLYRLNNLVGMKISFIDAITPSLTSTMNSITNVDVETLSTSAPINAAVFANGPIVVNSTANRFAILAISTQKLSESASTILPSSGLVRSITNIPADFSSPTLKARDTGDVSETPINLFTSTEIKSIYTQNILDKAKSLAPTLSDADINTVINSIPDTVAIDNGNPARILLPIIIYGGSLTSDIVINNAHPGLPISIYDAGVCSPFRFDTREDLTKDAGALSKTHASGVAIDITLLPYFARTGIFFKDIDPYILSKEYHPRKVSSHNKLMEDLNISSGIPILSRPRPPGNAAGSLVRPLPSVWDVVTDDPGIVIIGMFSPNEANDILNKTGVSSAISTNDLSMADQSIYHIETPFVTDVLIEVP